MPVRSLSCVPLVLVLAAAVAAQDHRGTLRVPTDRADPDLGGAELEYELGAPFDPAKPLVLVVADGQQFTVRKGALAGLQAELVGGDAANVVGLIGRGANERFQEAVLDEHGAVDWPRAWRVFRAEAWLDDLDQLRRELAGDEARVILYGVSGGAFLVHQYLARHGEHVERAYTAAAVQPHLVGSLGLRTDRFWSEIGAHDPESQRLLREALAAPGAERFTIAALLQRQNFFVPPADLPRARAELIRALAEGSESVLARRRAEYQVDPIRALLDAPAGIPIRVREFEFAWPAREAELLAEAAFHPDLEVHAAFARPLVDALQAGRIEAPSFDFGALHALAADVLVVAGRHDHTVDYRTSIALAAHYPRGELVLLDDDHMFHRTKEDGSLRALARAFLVHGPRSEAYRAAQAGLAAHRWRE